MTRVLTTIAGTGEPVVSGDGGPAISAAISHPMGLALDAEGNLYIASGPSAFAFDTRIRKIDKRGIITTVVGTGPLDYSGDGGPALSATMNSPQDIAFDPLGNLYIADGGNGRVRRVDKNGIITTVAGGKP